VLRVSIYNEKDDGDWNYEVCDNRGAANDIIIEVMHERELYANKWSTYIQFAGFTEPANHHK